MCEKLNIDDKTRFLVLYFDARLNVREISKILNRSRMTVKRWASITRKGQDIRMAKPKSGRPKIISEEIENNIVQMIKENNGASITKLAVRIGISRNTISKILAKKGYKYKAIAMENTITHSEEERMIRVDFCKKMLSDEGKLIYRTFFSDEMGVELNSIQRNRAWQCSTEKITKKVFTSGIKLDCWGAVSAQGATSLDIYQKGMKGELYRQVIERHKAEMEKIYPYGDFYFIQDNHPTHRMNEEWVVTEQQLNLIKLPKRSPDLNIIENLWPALKERVAGDAPESEKELRASLLKNWQLLTEPERLQQIFEGLHRRYMECVTKDGRKLSY